MSYQWPCIHRGADTGNTFNCGPALGAQPVFACNNAPLGGIPCVVQMCAKREFSVQGRLRSCASCNFRESPPEPLPIRESPNPMPVTKVPRLTPRGSRLEHRRRRRRVIQSATPRQYPAWTSDTVRRHLDRNAETSDKLVYVTSQMMIDDTLRLLLPQLPPDLAGIAGVPRSGSAPAAILATHLQLPLFTVIGDEVVDVGSGSRGRRGWAGDRGGKMLVVDDSVYGGGNMRRLRGALGDKALYAAVYVRPEKVRSVDFYAKLLPSPHLFQWNLLNGAPLIGRTINPVLHGGVALDFDGVICLDPDVSDHDEAKYLDWMENALPLNLPRRHKVPLIVTFRLEKYRQQTEAWMDRWQIRCDRLVMHPAATMAERNQRFNVAEHKGHAYRDSPCRLFIESSESQSRIIHRESGKPVLCLATGEILQ